MCSETAMLHKSQPLTKMLISIGELGAKGVWINQRFRQGLEDGLVNR